MKKIFFALVLTLYASSAFAAQDIPPGYPPPLDGMSASKPVQEIDYISPTVVPLTPKERKALSLSEDWARQNIDPVLSGGGKVVYVHGASLPTIVATPMQVSKDTAMVVDGFFERIALIVGLDGDQEKVEVIRGSK